MRIALDFTEYYFIATFRMPDYDKYPVFGEMFAKIISEGGLPKDEDFDEAVKNAGLTYDSVVQVDYVYRDAKLVLKEKTKKNALPLEKYRISKIAELVNEPQVRLKSVLELRNEIYDYFFC